jgi:hypothetical protein
VNQVFGDLGKSEPSRTLATQQRSAAIDNPQQLAHDIPELLCCVRSHVIGSCRLFTVCCHATTQHPCFLLALLKEGGRGACPMYTCLGTNILPVGRIQVTLTKEEMQMIRRIRAGQFPHVEVDPHLPEDDWFTRDLELHPLSSAPAPKRRFQPSKWEEKKCTLLSMHITYFTCPPFCLPGCTAITVTYDESLIISTINLLHPPPFPLYQCPPIQISAAIVVFLKYCMTHSMSAPGT